MSEETINFVNILAEKKLQNEDAFFMSHPYNPTIAFKQSCYYNPDQLKQLVLHSTEIKQVVEEIQNGSDKEKANLYLEASAILEEMALDRRLVVIRVLGVVLSKLFKQCCTGLLVDRSSIQKIKNDMGYSPVLFLPSHRSYADFILMAFVTFCEGLQVPAVAAGMDFHGMRGMGTVLRQTGAFFMRRTLSGADPLYKALFRRYVHALVQEHHTPLEFFIEGTRSRTAKALAPKTGLLSMALEPYFFGRVPDITIVPISISYDRVLEEELFAFELLGIPKPKETTKGLFHSLQRLNERYGAMRISFRDPISVKDFMSKRNHDRTVHGNLPAYMQTATKEEMLMVNELAHEVLHRQQEGMTISVINLIALILFYYETKNYKTTIGELERDIKKWQNILKSMGASTTTENVTDVLEIHKRMVTIDKYGIVNLIINNIPLTNRTAKINLKGHDLENETMNKAMPLIKLQIYLNPLFFYLCGPSLIMTVLKFGLATNRDELFKYVSELLDIFHFEFIIPKSNILQDFQRWIDYLINMKAIRLEQSSITILDENTVDVINSILSPYLYCYQTVFKILSKLTTEVTEKYIFVETQKFIEQHLFKSENKNISGLCYSLSLDAISNAISSCTYLGCLQKIRKNSTNFYMRSELKFSHWHTFLNKFNDANIYRTITKCKL